jgi:hypothetical protein
LGLAEGARGIAIQIAGAWLESEWVPVILIRLLETVEKKGHRRSLSLDQRTAAL